MKNFFVTLKNNRVAIGKKSLIVASGVAGAIIAGALAKRLEDGNPTTLVVLNEEGQELATDTI